VCTYWPRHSPLFGETSIARVMRTLQLAMLVTARKPLGERFRRGALHSNKQT
jgi:hypothetical protein